MASLLPPPRGVAFTFDVVLFAQSDNQIKTTPTLAAGDFVTAKADGTDSLGATGNLTTTPSEAPASSGIVKVSLSSSEMTADRVFVKWHDAAGAEWHDGGIEIHTAAQTFDTMDTNIDSILTDTGTDGVVVAPRTVEGALDEIEALRLMLAALVGKASGGGTTTVTFRDTGDSKDRIILTVDSSGNRSAVTLDAS